MTLSTAISAPLVLSSRIAPARNVLPTPRKTILGAACQGSGKFEEGEELSAKPTDTARPALLVCTSGRARGPLRLFLLDLTRDASFNCGADGPPSLAWLCGVEFLFAELASSVAGSSWPEKFRCAAEAVVEMANASTSTKATSFRAHGHDECLSHRVTTLNPSLTTSPAL